MRLRLNRCNCLALVLSAMFIIGPWLHAADLPILSATDSAALKAHLGKEVAVEGTVVAAAPGSQDKMRFLNFSETKNRGFVAAIVPAVYPKLRLLESYSGKAVRVTGTLEAYKKKTQIKVTRISQLKVLPPPKIPPGAKKS